MAIDLSNYNSSVDVGYKRDKVVAAALELLVAEAAGGKNIKPIPVSEGGNPVKKYADWIEEALKVKKVD